MCIRDSSVWASTVDNGRNVAENDGTGGESGTASTTAQFLRYNTPATGCSDITTTSPAGIDKTATPVAISDTLDLTGEIPTRFEMRMMIKANY